MRPRLSPRIPSLALILAVAALTVVIAACGGGDDSGQAPSGKLTDPGSVPTASPWASPPEVHILDPNALTPISGGATSGQQGNGSAAEGTPVPGNCGPKYKVVSGDYPGLIAEKCSITTEQLLQANPGLDPTGLHVGDTLNIPE